MRSDMVVGFCTALALIVLAALTSSSSAKDGVFQPNALVLRPQTDYQQQIKNPGDRNWYAISGPGLLTTSRIFVGAPMPPLDDPIYEPPPWVLQACPGRTPLLVTLYSPDGLRLRTMRAPAGDELAGHADMPGPELPGRYLVAVRAAEPGCAGLLYTISDERFPEVHPPEGSDERFFTAEVECQYDTNVRIEAEADLRAQKRRVNSAHGKKRDRYVQILRQYKRALAGARAKERHSCGPT